MTRKQGGRISPISKVSTPLRPNFPQHNYPEPYARLLTLGETVPDPIYDEIAAELKADDAELAADTLQKIALDETFYDYFDEESHEEDPRAWTRLHAIRVLQRLGPAAHRAIVPLLPLLDYDDDDWIQEEMPIFYAAIGEAAIEPLAKLLTDPDAKTMLRTSAGESLQEIAEADTGLRGRVLPILEQTLVQETEDKEVVGFVIGFLMDLGAREALPFIERAFAENRVDEFVVQMADVEEHFGLPRVSPRRHWNFTEDGLAFFGDEEEGEDDAFFETNVPVLEEEEEVQEPYVAPLKVGRNDPCPCGSGKKYKKCCGASQ